MQSACRLLSSPVPPWFLGTMWSTSGAARQAEAGAGKSSRRGRSKAAANPEQTDRHAAPAPSESLPPDLLTQVLQECGALSVRALLAASELEPGRFRRQLELEMKAETIRVELEEGERVLVGGG